MATVAVAALSGCEEGANPFNLKPKPSADGASPVADTAAAGATSVRLVDRDVEAPAVFQVTDQALWDGRPSLGGVWVASPDAVDPERVILRNPANGKFVIGALFRRERENPGPKLQISSDAAAALGLLAGQPGKLNVTALRREEAPKATPDAKKPILDAAESVPGSTLDGMAGAAIDAADPTKGKAGANAITGGAIAAGPIGSTPKAPVIDSAKPTAPTKAAAAPAAAKAATGSGGTVQIGIFSVEANAKRAADTLTKGGVTSAVKAGSTQGKAFWAVTASGGGDKAALLAKIKGLGFKDAYFLK